jgi:prepilin-type N-terminal cleavage/methylation domain-containing protein
MNLQYQRRYAPSYTIQGFSLMEALVALALVSILCIGLMRFQLRLLKQYQYIHYQQSVISAQRSLAERVRSCRGQPECQQLEIQQWGKNVVTALPYIKSEIVQHTHAITSRLYSDTFREPIILYFDHE